MQIISRHSCYVLKMGLAITVDFVRTPRKNELWSNMQTTLPQAPSWREGLQFGRQKEPTLWGQVLAGRNPLQSCLTPQDHRHSPFATHHALRMESLNCYFGSRLFHQQRLRLFKITSWAHTKDVQWVMGEHCTGTPQNSQLSVWVKDPRAGCSLLAKVTPILFLKDTI